MRRESADRFPVLGVAPRVDARLLGVSIFTEDGDHLPVHMAFESGLNVLYGLNGAGKSRTLRLLAVVTGRGSVEQQATAAFIQTRIDSRASLDTVSEDAGLTKLVDGVAALLRRSLYEYEPPEIVELIEESGAQVDFLPLDGSLYTESTTLGGLITVLMTARGFEPSTAKLAAEGGRFVLRPRATGGVDVYVGLPAGDLGPLWGLGKDLQQLLRTRPEIPDQAETDWVVDETPFMGYGWIESSLRADWRSLVRGEWEARMNAAYPGCLDWIEIAPVDTYRERERERAVQREEAVRKIGTLATFALAYVLGALASRAPHGADEPSIPAWAAVPILYLGATYEDSADWRWDFGAVLAGSEDLDTAITRLEQDLREVILDFVAAGSQPMFDTSGGTVQINRTCREKLDEFSALATSLLQEVLGGSAPELAVEVNPEEALRSGSPIRLVADDYSIFNRLSVRDLSEAQRRWAVIALRLAFANTFSASGPANVLLLDEPDGSLHVRARRSMADGLVRISDRLGVTTFATTHAVELIDHPSAKLWHTARAEGRIRLSLLSPADLANPVETTAEQFGVRNSDLLLLTRCWLIVEGDHDEAVLDAWLGDELRQCLVRILKMKGVSRALSVVDSQLLLDGSDAPIVVVADNTHAPFVKKVNALLREATDRPERAAATGAALKHLLHAQPSESEEQKLVELAVAAHRRGFADRLTVLGLSKPDIIEYLPADAFVPGATWPALVSEWKASGAAGSRSDFKGWLRASKGAKIHTQSLRQAVNPDAIPAEITAILNVVRAVTAGQLSPREVD